jgi:DNA-binding transcriptional ArsR family regulator
MYGPASDWARSSENRENAVTTPIYQVKAEFFKTLGHPARIRVLEVLRDGERTVSELVPEVGIEASHLSQQLGVLRRANLVQTRKEGNSVWYSVGNPMIFELLDVARRILTSSLDETRALLAELELPEPSPAPRATRVEPELGRSV